MHLRHTIKQNPVALAIILAGSLVLLAGMIQIDLTLVASFALLLGLTLTVFRMVSR